MKRLLLALFLFGPGFAVAEDNLRYFAVSEASHPLCGINPSFDGKPQNIPPLPFSRCRSIGIGFGINASYPDPGVSALSKLIGAIAEAGGEQKFGALSEPPLACRIAMPLGMGTPGAPLPVCTVAFVKAYLVTYDSQPIVVEFRRFERSIQQLDLSTRATIDKVRQAEAVVRATGPAITFGDVAELLK